MRLIRVDDRAVSVVAVISGVAAALSDVSPVGDSWLDATVVLLVVAVVTWASASATWWAGALAAGIGGLLALDPVITIVGAAASVTGMWLGTQRRNLSVVRAGVGGVGLNVLCRMEFEGFFGASAIVGVSLALMLLVVGLQRRHSSVRRWAWRAGFGLAAVAVVAGIGLGVAGLDARTDVNAGRRFVADGVDLLRDGKYADAAVKFDQAATTFSAAETTIGRPWAQPARLLPIAAQNREAAAVMSSRAATASAELANAALFIDPDDLKINDGRFDLDALAEIEGPLTSAYEAMVDLRAGIDAVDSPWLLPQIESPLDAAATEFDENIDQVETAVQALHLAPGMLGGDRARHYFIAFTTPAEARGLGGFMGNYAVITADDGALSMSGFGRTSELNRAGPDVRRVDAPEEWDARWGRFGITNGPDGTTGSVPWSNITMSAHFPSTAQVISELFPQSGGRQVDGVFAIDPFVLQAMIGFTGPVSIDAGEETQRRLTDSNTAEFLLFDQYAIEDAETRTDLLEQVAQRVTEQLLGGGLPGPTVLADRLGPLADEGRLVGWMGDADEQMLFERIGLSGRLPEHEGADGFQVIVNNAGANKLDAYLDRTVRYRAQFDSETGAVTGTLDVELTNNGPTSGLPSGVIDNYVGDPIGTNRTLVTAYTALPVTGLMLDGEVARFEPGTESGWSTSTLFVVIPPGESRTLSFTVAGLLPRDVVDDGSFGARYQLEVGTQPLVVPAQYDIGVTDADNHVLVEFTGGSPGHHRFVGRPPVPGAQSN